MTQITGIDATPKQKQTLLLSDGTELVITMEYKPQQFGWFFLNLTYGDFQINNIRIVTGTNMLRQYKNQLPFGIGCFVQENQEATLAEDFLSGRAKLFILSREEVQLFEDFLSD